MGDVGLRVLGVGENKDSPVEVQGVASPGAGVGLLGGLGKRSAGWRGRGSRGGGPWLTRGPPKARNETLPARN